jgi:hypothetical protein
MSVIATALRELQALGVTGEALAAAVERIEQAATIERTASVREAVEMASAKADREFARSRSKGAERMARYRQNRAESGLDPNFDGRRFLEPLRARDGDRCVYCLAAAGSVVDHMYPCSAGGTDDMDNLALACVQCNCGKAGRLLSDDGSEIKTPSARAAYVRYVRERVRGVRDNGERPRPLPSSPPAPPQQPTPTRESISTRAEREREDAGFARFWAAYPRKTAKADARKAFAKAWKKLPPFDEEAVLSGGLERAKAGWDDPRFIPHAATWLNREQWNDEPSTVIPIRSFHAPRPHPHDKLSRKEANLARSLAGFDAVAGRRRIEP